MTLLIVFNDGTEKRIENIRSYEYGKGTGCFQYSLNNDTRLGFVQKEGLRYFGPEEFWREPEKKEEKCSEVDLDEILKNLDAVKFDLTKSHPYNQHYIAGYNSGLTAAKYVVNTIFAKSLDISVNEGEKG